MSYIIPTTPENRFELNFYYNSPITTQNLLEVTKDFGEIDMEALSICPHHNIVIMPVANSKDIRQNGTGNCWKHEVADTLWILKEKQTHEFQDATNSHVFSYIKEPTLLKYAALFTFSSQARSPRLLSTAWLISFRVSDLVT